MKFSTKQYKNHSVYQPVQNFLNKKVQNIIHKQEEKKQKKIIQKCAR